MSSVKGPVLRSTGFEVVVVGTNRSVTGLQKQYTDTRKEDDRGERRLEAKAEEATGEQTEKEAKAENVLFDEYRVSQQIFNRILDI